MNEFVFSLGKYALKLGYFCSGFGLYNEEEIPREEVLWKPADSNDRRNNGCKTSFQGYYSAISRPKSKFRTRFYMKIKDDIKGILWKPVFSTFTGNLMFSKGYLRG